MADEFQIDKNKFGFSKIGLGSSAWGGSAEPSPSQLRELLGFAKRLGVNWIDTAASYGKAQQRIGDLVRDDSYWSVGTKVGEVEPGVYRFNTIPAQLEAAQRQLGLNYLNYVLLHMDAEDNYVDMETGMVELNKAKSGGLTQLIGASVHTPRGAAIACGEGADVLMFGCRGGTVPVDMRPWVEYARRRGIITIGIKLLNQKPDDFNPAMSVQRALTHEHLNMVAAGTRRADHLLDWLRPSYIESLSAKYDSFTSKALAGLTHQDRD